MMIRQVGRVPRTAWLAALAIALAVPAAASARGGMDDRHAGGLSPGVAVHDGGPRTFEGPTLLASGPFGGFGFGPFVGVSYGVYDGIGGPGYRARIHRRSFPSTTYRSSGRASAAEISTAAPPAVGSVALPYLTGKTYEPGDGRRYPLYFDPNTGTYFYHPVAR